eukprot:6964912-Pyramimonas_sp.AAC.1
MCEGQPAPVAFSLDSIQESNVMRVLTDFSGARPLGSRNRANGRKCGLDQGTVGYPFLAQDVEIFHHCSFTGQLR